MASLLITQQNAAKPATELAFPSVTICSSGLNMEAVKEAIAKDFKEWKEEEGRSKEDIDEFMEEKYAMAVGKENIFEKIKAMTLPPMDKESRDIIALAENLLTCKANSMSGRRKREAVNAGPNAHHLAHITVQGRVPK